MKVRTFDEKTAVPFLRGLADFLEKNPGTASICATAINFDDEDSGNSHNEIEKTFQFASEYWMSVKLEP